MIYIYIYVGRSVGMSAVSKKCVGGNTLPKRAHAQSQIWAVKTDLLYDTRVRAALTRTKKKCSLKEWET